MSKMFSSLTHKDISLVNIEIAMKIFIDSFFFFFFFNIQRNKFTNTRIIEQVTEFDPVTNCDLWPANLKPGSDCLDFFGKTNNYLTLFSEKLWHVLYLKPCQTLMAVILEMSHLHLPQQFPSLIAIDYSGAWFFFFFFFFFKPDHINTSDTEQWWI